MPGMAPCEKRGVHHIRSSGLTYFSKRRDPNEHGGPYKDDKTGSGLIFWEPYTQNEQRYLSLGESSLPSFFGLATISAIFRIAAHHGPLDTDESVCCSQSPQYPQLAASSFSSVPHFSYPAISPEPWRRHWDEQKNLTFTKSRRADFHISNSVKFTSRQRLLKVKSWAKLIPALSPATRATAR